MRSARNRAGERIADRDVDQRDRDRKRVLRGPERDRPARDLHALVVGVELHVRAIPGFDRDLRAGAADDPDDALIADSERARRRVRGDGMKEPNEEGEASGCAPQGVADGGHRPIIAPRDPDRSLNFGEERIARRYFEGREDDGEYRAALGTGRRRDRAAVDARDAAHDRETQARALDRARVRGVAAEEAVEQPLGGFGRDADSGVGDRDARTAGLGARRRRRSRRAR